MADLYTGKYLDGAGLQILWNKLKTTFAALAGDNQFDGTNTFAKTIVVPGVKTSDGQGLNLFIDNGNLKPIADFATSTALTTATGRIDTIEANYVKKDGSVAVEGTLTATGFKVGTQTGFLKANGTVDNNAYALKSDFDDHNHDGVYVKVAGDTMDGTLTIGSSTNATAGLTVYGAATFNNAAGIKAKKFVVDGGTADNLLLANGAVKPVSYFATSTALTTAANRITTIEGSYIKKDGSVTADLLNLSAAITADTQATTKKYVDDKVSAAIDTAIGNLGAVLEFKGSVSLPSDLPTSAALGDVWVVAVAGIYAGEVCEVGDMLICTAASTTAPTWTIIQRNIPGVLTEADINSILV